MLRRAIDITVADAAGFQFHSATTAAGTVVDTATVMVGVTVATAVITVAATVVMAGMAHPLATPRSIRFTRSMECPPIMADAGTATDVEF